MAYQRITSSQRQRINSLRDRAWSAGLTEATFSQIAKDPAGWETQIRQAEQDAAQAEREAAEAATHQDAVSIIAILRQAGMSVRAIAAAVGVHVSTVYRWARGLFRPATTRYTTLAALAV
jgi:DNA-binding transcriptional regulator YiaG